jgi:hypothetical protein
MVDKQSNSVEKDTLDGSGSDGASNKENKVEKQQPYECSQTDNDSSTEKDCNKNSNLSDFALFTGLTFFS